MHTFQFRLNILVDKSLGISLVQRQIQNAGFGGCVTWMLDHAHSLLTDHFTVG